MSAINDRYILPEYAVVVFYWIDARQQRLVASRIIVYVIRYVVRGVTSYSKLPFDERDMSYA